jgi:thiol-disulfide isomerase/thioredoxin
MRLGKRNLSLLGRYLLTASALGILASDALSQSKTSVSNFTSVAHNTTPTPIRPLSIGDQVPDIAFENVLNYKSKKAKLSDFKGKLVILDMWSTWCTSCIAAFPEMEKLQNEFNDKIQILLVNPHSPKYDSEIKINSLLEKLKKRTGFYPTLPIPIHDSVLNSYFPHRSVPHEVWIDGSGKVIAITSTSEVNKENIQTILSGKELPLHTKKDDLTFDSRKPLFIDGNGGNGSNLMYRSIITGYQEGLGSVTGVKLEQNGSISRLYVLNQSLLSLYKRAFAEKITSYSDNRTLIEVADPSNFNYSESTKYNSTFCYELIVPPSTEEQIKKTMQMDLERFFHVTIKNVRRKMKCFVLKANRKADLFYSKYQISDLDIEQNTQHKYIRKYTASQAVKLLNQYFPLPLIDETGLINKIDLELPYDLTNITDLKECFFKQGFDLIEAEREIDVVVFTDN